jgi:Domain of unknown function (DUF397)
VTAKPAVDELAIDVAALHWQRSGAGDGTIEVAMVTAAGPAGGDWVLLRVAGDPARRVLVYDRHEWECFLDGVRNGEFDDGAALDAVELGKQAAGRQRQGRGMAVGGRSPRSVPREFTCVIHKLCRSILSATPCQGGDLR